MDINTTAGMPDVLSFMPVPIKFLQSVPFAASFVFGELELSTPGGKKGTKKKSTNKKSDNGTEPEIISAIARRLAQDLPEYSSRNQSNKDGDATEEARIMQEDTASTLEDTEKCQSLCEYGDIIGRSKKR